MLVIKPDPNNNTAPVKALNAYLDGSPCGYVRFCQNGYILEITELLPLAPAGEKMDKPTYALLDTILRALGSYGLNHCCYYLTCDNPLLFSTLEQLRFVRRDGMMKSDLSRILSHCGDH